MRILVSLLLLIASAALVAACDDDNGDDTNGDAELTDEDRTAVEQTIDDYFSALRDQDQDRMRDMLHQDADDPDMDRVMEQQSEHEWELIEIESLERDQDQVTAMLRLQDGSGEEVTRELHLEIDQDQWRLRDPELHE